MHNGQLDLAAWKDRITFHAVIPVAVKGCEGLLDGRRFGRDREPQDFVDFEEL